MKVISYRLPSPSPRALPCPFLQELNPLQPFEGPIEIDLVSIEASKILNQGFRACCALFKKLTDSCFKQ